MESMKQVYLIGSLRNKQIPVFGNWLRNEYGLDVFDDWHAAGPEADDHWQAYERARGHTYEEALAGPVAQNAFQFDRRHIQASSAAVMVMPAGKSGHLELGYAAGLGKTTAILLAEEPERFDLMYNFATLVTHDRVKLATFLKETLR